MTNHLRNNMLQPMGRGILDSDATCTAARQESLRTWAAARRGASAAAPAASAVTLAKRASAPRR